VGRLGADARRALALEIADAVVAACAPHNVPVTLKMRTGWSASERNACASRRRRERRRRDGHRARPHREQGYKGSADTTPSPR
jgi:tRNA-dihydrouridine synthase B